MQVSSFHSLVNLAIKHSASDIHVRADEVPLLRIRGELHPIQSKALSTADVEGIIKILLGSDENMKKFFQYDEHDGAYEVSGVCRLRYNFFKYQGKRGIIIRLIKTTVPTIDQLGLHQSLKSISLFSRGLVLVTGETGSGKSTTLASMINEINHSKATHIITIEDPVEYVHTQKKSRVTQREVGVDTKDFTSGLRSALRQDPDIILIGEMRDPETVGIALKAAETGHLVFSTVHTTDAISTIGRIISLFPSSEQEDVKKRLAENLKATISQRLLPASTPTGLIAAQEIMISGPGIKECILGEAPLSQIQRIIAKARGQKTMQTFDQHILELYQNRKITKDTALNAVNSQTDFIQKLAIDDEFESEMVTKTHKLKDDDDDEIIR
ncbi:MAG: type IV pilus twitching motility protein PilT [Bacteriovoracaceae bacterium]